MQGIRCLVTLHMMCSYDGCTDEATDMRNKTKPQQPHQITGASVITWEWEDICAYRSLNGVEWHRLPGHQGIRFANTSNIDNSQAAIAPGPTDSALHISTGAEWPPQTLLSKHSPSLQALVG